MTAEGNEMNDPSFWKLRNIKDTYWNEYIDTRPQYDFRIFDPILEYHTSPFDGALDVGTGSGSALPTLTEKFALVVATDNDPTSLQFTQHRFSKISAERLQYKLSSGEDLKQHFPPESFDLITCAETFPLMDTDEAFASILSILKPGGTLAIWFYGPPFFVEPEFATTCQDILDQIMDHNFRPVVSGGGPARMESWKRAADGMSSWLDYIPFSQNSWQNIVRHKWNTNARLSFFGPSACDFDVDPVSKVQDNERVIKKHDATFWERNWDVAMVKRFVGASFPKPSDLKGEDAKMNSLFKRLEDAMGGTHAKRLFSWPVVLILARKRSQ